MTSTPSPQTPLSQTPSPENPLSDTGSPAAARGSEARRATDRPTPAEAFERLRRSFASGRTRSVGWRTEQLQGIERMVTEHETEFLQAMADDFGKPRFEAWMTDLMPVAAEATHAARQVARWMRPRWTWPAGPTSRAGRGRWPSPKGPC
jgi:aldehyde dehydrogenase (NAD+)